MTSFQCSLAAIILGAIGFLVQMGQLIFTRNKKISAIGWSAIILAFLMVLIGVKGLNLVEWEKAKISHDDSIKNESFNKRIETLNDSFNDSISVLNGNLTDIKKALTDKKLVWDSVNKTIHITLINNHSKNVSSHNQKGGQTGFDIHN